MKHHRMILAIAVLVLATLACQAVVGGEDGDVDDIAPATGMPAAKSTEAGATNDSVSAVSSQFPMTADAYNVVEVEDGSLVYYTKLSVDEAMQFF